MLSELEEYVSSQSNVTEGKWDENESLTTNKHDTNNNIKIGLVEPVYEISLCTPHCPCLR